MNHRFSLEREREREIRNVKPSDLFLIVGLNQFGDITCSSVLLGGFEGIDDVLGVPWENFWPLICRPILIVLVGGKEEGVY